ncbi:hypothetical protein G6F58_008395 [Rhizopus delemar]|nr:hypothetical protein G6F58_008395 [Rhizopus delemar]
MNFIVANDSSVINTLGTGTFISDQQRQPTEVTLYQEEDFKSIADSAHFYDEEDDEEDKIPSNLSIDHHPKRTCDNILTFTESDTDPTDTEAAADGSKWILNDTCISDLCFNLKNITVQLVKHVNTAQLSDIRLLALNDVYTFDRNFASSVSKYFSTKIHTTLKPTLSFDAYLPKRGLSCYDSCMSIEVSPPVDWVFSLTLCAELLTKACKSKNHLDIHTAQVLTQVLPVLINGPPNDSNEDSYVHYYLSPLLSSVFASDPLLKMKWANGQVNNNDNNSFKPDFLVYNLSESVKCVVLIVEFKLTEQNSYVESDLVKLAKQMKATLNKLITSGVTMSKVCGIHCEGENVHTYVIALPCSKLYRMTNASKVKLFKDLNQISLLPNIITHMLCLKGVASETAVHYSYSNLKRPVPLPPLNWLSNDNGVLSRVPKRQKK